MNLVLDDVTESLRGMFPYPHIIVLTSRVVRGPLIPRLLTYHTDPEDSTKLSGKTRQLGVVVARGPLLLTISPVDGMEEIENPFVQQPVE